MPDLPEQEKMRIYKAFAISAVGAGVGFGTCGLVFLTQPGGNSFAMFIAYAGALLFFVSLAGVVITALIALWAAIASHFDK